MYAFLIGFLFSVIYSVIAIVMYQVEKRALGSDFPAFWGIIWPISVALYATIIVIVSPFAVMYGFVWLIDIASKKLLKKTDIIADQLVLKVKKLFPKKNTKIKIAETEVLIQPQPMISIPYGATIRSEDYRRLKPMLEQYEANLPVTERE